MRAFCPLNIEYPELPVVEHKDEFLELLEKHQVIIVKADTGSGKSTQLPKFLLEYFLGRQNKAVILEGQSPDRIQEIMDPIACGSRMTISRLLSLVFRLNI